MPYGTTSSVNLRLTPSPQGEGCFGGVCDAFNRIRQDISGCRGISGGLIHPASFEAGVFM